MDTRENGGLELNQKLLPRILGYVGVALLSAALSAAVLMLGLPRENADRLTRLEERYRSTQSRMERMDIKLDLVLEEVAKNVGAREESERAYQKVLEEYRRRLRSGGPGPGP